MATLLIKHNANTEKRHEEFETPLHTAPYFNNVEVAKLLVEYDADIEASDEDKQRLLHTATYYDGTKVVKCYQNIRQTPQQGVQTKKHLQALLHHLLTDVAELLLNYKTEIGAKNKNDQTPLHNAAKQSKKAIVQLLLKLKADIEARIKDEKTTLQLVLGSATFFPREDHEAVQNFLVEYDESTTNI